MLEHVLFTHFYIDCVIGLLNNMRATIAAFYLQSERKACFLQFGFAKTFAQQKK
jgi:hypothetical protein